LFVFGFLAPVKRLVRKMVSKMTYIVSSGTSNSTILIYLHQYIFSARRIGCSYISVKKTVIFITSCKAHNKVTYKTAKNVHHAKVSAATSEWNDNWSNDWA